jgi:hypothetical protein
MEVFVDTFRVSPAASIFGIAGLVCQLVWPVFKNHRTIMSVQFGIGANYGFSYALLDAWSGAGVASVGAMQSAIAFLGGERPWLRWVSVACLPVVMAIGYATWSGLPSAFALAAVTLIIIGRMQRDTLRLRVLLLAASPFGMGYDILIGAAPALVGGIVSGAIAALKLAREIRGRRWNPPARVLRSN